MLIMFVYSLSWGNKTLNLKKKKKSQGKYVTDIVQGHIQCK